MCRNESESSLCHKRPKLDETESLLHPSHALNLTNQIPNNFSTLYTAALALHFHQQNQQQQQNPSNYLSKLPLGSLLHTQMTAQNGLYLNSDPLLGRSATGKNEELKLSTEESDIDEEGQTNRCGVDDEDSSSSSGSSSSTSQSTASIDSKTADNNDFTQNSEILKKTGSEILYDNQNKNKIDDENNETEKLESKENSKNIVE